MPAKAPRGQPARRASETNVGNSRTASPTMPFTSQPRAAILSTTSVRRGRIQPPTRLATKSARRATRGRNPAPSQNCPMTLRRHTFTSTS
eukprot:3594893-Alexandrium_andersonii.AAC.1